MMDRQRFGALMAAAAIACGGSLAASAQVRTLSTVSGVPLRLTHHTVFSFKTCTSTGIAQITSVKTPEGGRIWHQTEMTKLESSASPEGQHCVGKSIQSVVVYYQGKADWIGTETIEYVVKFPASCKNCQDRTVKVAINVTPPTAPPAPAPETGAAEQTPQMSGSTFRRQRPPRDNRDASTN